MSHTAGVPSAFCHRMSALPSPLKSPAPTACQEDPDWIRQDRQRRTSSRSSADRGRAVGVLPQKVGLAVTVEIAGSLQVPGGTGFDRAAPDTKLVPFISQIAGVPSVFCHKMSTCRRR